MRNGFELFGELVRAIHAAMVGAANLEDSTLPTGLHALCRRSSARHGSNGATLYTVHELVCQ